MHGKWEQLSAQLENHKQVEMQLSSTLQTKEAKVVEMREQIAALDESINDLQTVLLHASEELEKLEGRKEVLKERKKNAKQNKEQLEKNIQTLSLKIDELEREKAEQEAVAATLENEAAEIEETLVEKQKQLKLFSENIEETIESLKSDYIEILNQQATYKNELQNVEAQLWTTRSSQQAFGRGQREISGRTPPY